MKRLLLLLACSSVAAAQDLEVRIPTSPAAAQVYLNQGATTLDLQQTTDHPVRLQRSWFFDPAGNAVPRTLIFRLPDHEDAQLKVNWGNLDAQRPLTDEKGHAPELRPLTWMATLKDHPLGSSAGALVLLLAGAFAATRLRRRPKADGPDSHARRLHHQEQLAQTEAARRHAQEAELSARRAAQAAEQERAILSQKQQAIQEAAGKDPWIGTEIVSPRLGAYTPVKLIGRGGMGRVYLAQAVRPQPGSPPRLALKVAEQAADSVDHQRVISEGQLGMKLSHPSIVRCFDYVDQSDRVWLFLELVEGGQTLRSRLSTSGTPLRQLMPLVKPVAAGLHHLHGLGMVHRDIKPDNVLVSTDGQSKITDLGFAKNPQLQLTTSMEAFGTLAYVPPEQLTGTRDVGPPADQYAFGCMIYELVEGRLPFSFVNNESEYVMAHLSQPPNPMKRASPATAAVIARMLEKEPTKRYASMVEAWLALEASLAPAAP